MMGTMFVTRDSDILHFHELWLCCEPHFETPKDFQRHYGRWEHNEKCRFAGTEDGKICLDCEEWRLLHVRMKGGRRSIRKIKWKMLKDAFSKGKGKP